MLPGPRSGGSRLTEREELGIELLLSEPEIVASLEPPEAKDDEGEGEVVRFPREGRRPAE